MSVPATSVPAGSFPCRPTFTPAIVAEITIPKLTPRIIPLIIVLSLLLMRNFFELFVLYDEIFDVLDLVFFLSVKQFFK